MKKRIIGFLLACVMMLTLLPTMAFASTTTLKVTANKTKVNCYLYRFNRCSGKAAELGVCAGCSRGNDLCRKQR